MLSDDCNQIHASVNPNNDLVMFFASILALFQRTFRTHSNFKLALSPRDNRMERGAEQRPGARVNNFALLSSSSLILKLVLISVQNYFV